MMGKASGYVLVLPKGRRDVFLECLDEGQWFAEPVPEFSHSRNIPLICFVISEDGIITHLARGRRGVRAGTGLRRLNIDNAEIMVPTISVESIVTRVSARVRKRVSECLMTGGLLPPKSFQAVVDAVQDISPNSQSLLAIYSRDRINRIRRLSSRAREALAEQKEAVATALFLAGLSREPLQQWVPSSDSTPLSFLEGLPTARLREDPMVIHDLFSLPGYDLLKTFPYNAAVFEGKSVRLTVILANRQPLEQQLGTDLIYFNETYSSFVMVQYKAMEQEDGEPVFRLPSKQLAVEIKRMETVLAELQACEPNDSLDGFRLNENPFFLKLCPRIVFNPDDGGLVNGMYIPFDYWQFLHGDPSLEGARGGRRVTYRNVGRYFDNTSFMALVAKAWIGTTTKQSLALKKVIRATLESGKAVALAIKKDGMY